MYDTLISSSSLRAVPWHNSCRDTYFFGNSVVGASGTPEGEWTFLIGPDVPTGFCGHTAALFLYDMVCLNEPEAALRTARGILDSPLLSMYGTVSEFYGPSCVPNGHNCRGFEGGITGEALMRCFAAFSPNTRLSPERIDHHEETSQSR